MTSRSKYRTATFYGGPLDGSQYQRRGAAFPEQLRIPVDERLYLYRCSVKVDRGRLDVTYRFAGWTNAGAEVVR